MDALVKSGAQRPVFARREKVRSAIPVVGIVVALFGFSGGLLWVLGYNYDGVSGSAFTKIHPATYLIVATFLWNAVTYGNPVGYAVRGARQLPGSLLLLTAMVALFTHIVFRSAPGMAGASDTFLGPPLAVYLMSDLDERGMRHVEITLHSLMTVNAAMALIEFVINMRFFPYRLDGVAIMNDARSSALQGHPLENAAFTVPYCLALLNGCPSLPKAFKLPLVGLQVVALVTFGSRSAVVVSIVLIGLYLAGATHRTLRNGRVPTLTAATALILVALMPTVIGVLAAGGFFDALTGRFVSDSGSAASRVEMFSMFGDQSFGDLLVGPDFDSITTLRRINGLEWGIENPIIKMLLYQGILITALMTIAVIAFLREIALLCVRGIWLPMLSFVIMLNAFESISGKTTLLTKFAVAVLCLYPHRSNMAPMTLQLWRRLGLER